jgi:hypothetical protein
MRVVRKDDGRARAFNVDLPREPRWNVGLGASGYEHAMIMSMATLTRRLQVLLEEERFAQLEHLARQRGTTVAALVRDALDRTYASDLPPAHVAAERFLAREPIDLGSWDDAKRDIEDSLDRDLS